MPEVVSPGEATRPATDSISLDQVFGDEGSRSSGGRLRPPVEDEGDLDQFQAWLRGLKS